MSFIKFLVMITGLSNSLLIAMQQYTPLTQEHILPLLILVQTNHHQQIQKIKKIKKQERINQENITIQQKKSEQKRTKNKINKPGKYVGRYNSHI